MYALANFPDPSHPTTAWICRPGWGPQGRRAGSQSRRAMPAAGPGRRVRGEPPRRLSARVHAGKLLGSFASNRHRSEQEKIGVRVGGWGRGVGVGWGGWVGGWGGWRSRGSAAAAAGAVGVAGLALARVAAPVADERAGLDVLGLGHLHPPGRHHVGHLQPEAPAPGRGGVPSARHVRTERQEGLDAIGAAPVRCCGERREPHHIHGAAGVLRSNKEN